jgi:hypothetical protein
MGKWRWCQANCAVARVGETRFNLDQHHARPPRFASKLMLEPDSTLITLNYRTGAKRPISRDVIATASSIGCFAPVLQLSRFAVYACFCERPISSDVITTASSIGRFAPEVL